MIVPVADRPLVSCGHARSTIEICEDCGGVYHACEDEHEHSHAIGMKPIHLFQCMSPDGCNDTRCRSWEAFSDAELFPKYVGKCGEDGEENIPFCSVSHVAFVPSKPKELVECGHLESLEETCNSCGGKFHYCSSADCHLFTATCEHVGGCTKDCDSWSIEYADSYELKNCDEAGLACLRREHGDGAGEAN